MVKMTLLRKIYISVLALSASLLWQSCSVDPVAQEDGPVTVGFMVGGEPDTKTALDGTTAKFSWTEGDQIAVFAKNSQGSYTLSGQTFSLLASKAPSTGGYFSSTLSGAMPEDTYTYYMAYPLPDAVSGTKLTYSLPSVQDGKSGGAAGILIAQPATYGPLKAIDENLPVPDDKLLSVRMKPILHYLRFYIPEGFNALGEPVERIDFTMPKGVAGTVTADYLDASASLSDPTGNVSLRLSDRIGEGEYACAGIFPPDAAYGENDLMQLSLYSDTKYATVEPIMLSGRDFPAGHITSVPLKPRNVQSVFRMNFTLVSNNLGEEVRNLSLSLPSGTNWPDTQSNVLTYTEPDGSDFLVGESFQLTTLDESAFRVLSGKSVTVSYESEDAIVTENITLPDLSAAYSFTSQLHCPYLMFEDFSAVESFSNHDKETTSDLGAIDPKGFLNGWSLARGGANAGTAIRLAARRENGLWIQNRMDARCDSPYLTGIKPGKSVSVSLEFDYSMNRDEGAIKAEAGATLHVGYTPSGKNYKSNSTDGSFPESVHLNNPTGSYTVIDNHYSITMSGLTSSHRISWRDVADEAGGVSGLASNGEYYIYLDNIRVSISKK